MGDRLMGYGPAGGATAPIPTAPFPGAIGLSHLRVYRSIGPDGLAGGTPHCHTACTEAYAVVAGSGRVQTLAGDGFRETPLEPGTFMWFTPGTIHRLVNDGGDLEILVLMQNAGLPEAGDMVITFTDDVLADPDRYKAAAVLPADHATTQADDGAARRRRDLGVQGFGAIVAAVNAGDPSALSRFHGRAAALVRPQVERWRRVWEAGPAAAVAATDAHLRALATGDGAHLAQSGVQVLPPPPDERRYGCCGTLGTYVRPG